MSRLAVAAVAAVASLAAAAPTARADDAAPPGKLAVVVGARNGTGALGNEYGLGFLRGVEASWQPLPDGRRIGYAIHWDVLFVGFGSDSAALTGSLKVVELSLGARLRLAPRDSSRAVFLGGGASLLRATSPLPPDGVRDYAGGFAGFGVEQLAWAGSLVSVEIRYGLFGGPGALSAMLGIGFGV
ncbi:MAG: hypothetical protein H6709_10880 [Kofleriaceae bacterium]|nr:hypothetical protein [Kofleriaceae bacterium]